MISKIVKNLAYSVEQLSDFLEEMKNVEKISDEQYQYKTVIISLSKLEETDKYFKIKRSLMTLEGDILEIDEFYYQFLLNHMTMGG